MKRKIALLLVAVLTICIFNYSGEAFAAGPKTYTISAKTKPCDNSVKYTTYNKNTKNYYTILSYLKKMEKKGGTLILKKGTYKISNTLFIPSNVTIKLSDGVVIKKIEKTGVEDKANGFPASKAIFTFCTPSKAAEIGVYSAHKGVHNSQIIGEGKAVIDLNYAKDTVAIMMGHNKNVTIAGITFNNMNSGHFIEMDAGKNICVDNCIFEGHKDSPKNNKEAINLDTPDLETNGFHADWSTYDKTPNEDVTITNCTFTDLERAIGTHKYSEGSIHKNINIIGNTITRCDQDAIRVMNWDNVVIKDNVIDTVTDGTDKNYRGVLFSGASHVTMTDNTFKNVARAAQFIVWKNTGDGENYAMIYNELTDEEKKLMGSNVLINGKEPFIRWSKEYEVYDRNTEKFPIKTE